MLFKKTDRKHLHPYVTLTVGALAVIGAVSVVKCAKSMMRCGCEKVSCMVKDMMGKGKNEMCEQ